MKILFRQSYHTTALAEEDFTQPSIREDIEKTHRALEIAYAGFDNATDPDMIDCYIYEINALLMRYKHLTELSAAENADSKQPLRRQSSPIRTLVSHVLG